MVLKKILTVNNVIKNVVKTNEDLTTIANNYSEYMANNNYVIYNKSKLIIHDNQKESKRFIKNNALQLQKNNILKFKNRIKIVILSAIKVLTTRALNKKIKIETNEKVFSGQLLMILHGQNRVKIFDFNNNQVITIESNRERLNRISETVAVYQNHFDVPIKEINHERKMINEKIIEFLPSQDKNSQHKVKLYHQFLERYLTLIRSLDLKETITLRAQLEKVNPTFKIVCTDLIKEFNQIGLDTKLVKIPQHGDIIKKNFLYDGSKWYLIDFEHSDNSAFIKDLFSIFIPDIMSYNKVLFNKFLKGEFDSKINSIFNQVDLVYDNSKSAKIEYLVISFIFRYTSRSLYDKDLTIEKMISNIQKFSNNLKTISYADNV